MTEWIVSSVVLIVVVALVRQLLKGKISLRLQYALWAIVLVRLLLPVTFGESKISVLNVLAQTTSLVEQMKPAEEPTVSDPGSEPVIGNTDPVPTGTVETPITTPGIIVNPNPIVSDDPDPVVSIVPDPGPASAPETPPVDEPIGAPIVEAALVLNVVWLCGIAVVALWFVITNLHFRLRLRRSRRAVELDSPIPVYVTGAVETPCLFGLFRPAVYLTPEVAEDEAALRHMLAHELTHYHHWDHVWAVLRCVCLAVHWYNPLVWLAASLSRRDAELACDEGAIRRIGEEERTAYGRTLIGLTCAHRSNLLHTATTMTGSKKSIKERIVLIAKKPKMAVYTLVAVILIAAVAVGCTFTGAKGKDGLSRLAKIEEDSITLAVMNGRCELPEEQYGELVDLLHRAAEQPVLKEELAAESGDYSDGVEYAMTLTTSDGDTCIVGCIPEDDGGAQLWIETFGLGTDPEKYTMYWIEFDELFLFIKQTVADYMEEGVPADTPQGVLDCAEQVLDGLLVEYIELNGKGDRIAMTALRQHETGTAGLNHAAFIYSLNYTIYWENTQVYDQRYMVLGYNYFTCEYTLLDYFTSDELYLRYGTEEMRAKYDDSMFVAAASELLDKWMEENPDLKWNLDFLDLLYEDDLIALYGYPKALDEIFLKYGGYVQRLDGFVFNDMSSVCTTWENDADGDGTPELYIIHEEGSGSGVSVMSLTVCEPDGGKLNVWRHDSTDIQNEFNENRTAAYDGDANTVTVTYGIYTHILALGDGYDYMPKVTELAYISGEQVRYDLLSDGSILLSFMLSMSGDGVPPMCYLPGGTSAACQIRFNGEGFEVVDPLCFVSELTEEPDPNAELIAYFQNLLAFDGGNTHYNGAMTCVYDSPEDINLEYVFYNRFPGGEEWSDFTEEEKAYLIAEGTKKNLGFGDIPAQKRHGIQLEQALQAYFGVSLSQVQIPDSWVYYKDTNSYYSSHGDTHAMQLFTVTKVERGVDDLIYVYYTAEGPIYRQDGTTLDGWEHNMVLTLRGQASIGGSSNDYVVLANQQLGTDTNEPDTPADALSIMGSELGVTLFERTWMPTHTLWLQTNSHHFTKLLQLLSERTWVQVEQEFVTSDFRTTFISPDYTKTLTIYSGSDGLVEYSCEGVTIRWRPEERIIGADSDYALKAKDVYQTLEYHPNQVVEADDPLTAAKAFVESYGAERLSWSPGHPRRAADFKLLNWSVDGISTDGTAVVVLMDYALLPDGNYDNFMFGGIMEGTGELEGWVTNRSGFLLVCEDGIWRCAEYGGGLYGEDLSYYGYTPMEEWEIEELLREQEYALCQVDGSETDYSVIAQSLAEQYAQCILNRSGWVWGQVLDVQVKSTEVFDAYYGEENPNFCFEKLLYIKVTEEQRNVWETGSGLEGPITEGPYAGYYVHGMEVSVRKLEDGNWHMTGMGTGGAMVGLPVNLDSATTRQLMELYFLTSGTTHDWRIIYRLGETPVEEVRACLNELEPQQRQELTEALKDFVTTYPDYAVWKAEDL